MRLRRHTLLFPPVQMLWMNVVTNGVQDIALAFEPAEGDELNRPPRPPSEGILSRTLWFRAGATGAWMALALILASSWNSIPATPKSMPEPSH